MVRVLVTAAGGFIGLGAVESLVDYSDHYVVATDMDPDAPGLYIADDAYTVPPADADGWVQSVATIADSTDVDVVVPLLNVEMPKVGGLVKALSDDVAVITPRDDVREIGLDKFLFAKTFREQGLPVPETRLLRDFAEDSLPSEFPLIVKPRRGSASEGVKRLDSMEELRQYREFSEHEPDELVVQALVDGREFTSSVVGTQDNELVSIVVKEAIRKEGGTVRGATRREPSVERACEDVFSELKPAGPMNVQQIQDERTGDVYTIEINPRFSASACFTVAAGVNEFDILIRDALGEPVPKPDEYRTDLHMIRHRSQMYVDEADLIEG